MGASAAVEGSKQQAAKPKFLRGLGGSAARILKRRWVLVALALLALSPVALRAARYLWKMRPTTVTVDVSQTYQTMTGWEFSARASEFDKPNDRYNGEWLQARDQVLRAAVEDLGLNRIRIEIPSGAEKPVDYWSQFAEQKIGYKEFKRHFYEKVNDNDDPHTANPAGFQFSSLDYKVVNFLLPMRKMLEQRGEKLVVNFCFVDFNWTDLKGTLNHAKDPAEYAEIVTESFKRLRDMYGVEVDYLELILEPDNTDDWRGTQIGQAAVEVMARLKSSGFQPKLIVPSTCHAPRALPYLEDVLKVPGAAELISVLSYHRYGPKPTDDYLSRLRDEANELGIETGMLEYVGGNVDHLHADLTLANVGSWQAYGLLGKFEPGEELARSPYLLGHDLAGEHPEVKLSGNSRLLRHYFKNIRVGAVRLGASTSNGFKRPVLFRNKNGRLVFVLNSEKRGKVTIVGLPAGEYRAELTLAEGGEEAPHSITVEEGVPYVFDMPGSGVFSLVGAPSPQP